MNRAGLLGAALLLTSALSGHDVAYAKEAALPVVPSETQVRQQADALIAQMTPEEKAGQLSTVFALPIPTMMSAVEKQVESGSVGSLLFVSDAADTNRLQRIAMEKSRLKIPLLFGFDVIHGLTTIFPVPVANAASWDPATAEHNQAVAAAEARAVGIHWTFAPMVDISRDPRWGRMIEGAGEDPYLGSAMAAAQVRGFQGPVLGTPGRIIAGPKHFAGYGAVLGGRDYEEVDLSDSQLWNVYLPPFKAAIDAGAGNIMSAYMGVNGVPATGNKWLLTDVLRKAWGFKGWVVSDNEAVKNLRVHGLGASTREAGVNALNAGLDMEMALFGPAFARLPQALSNGEVKPERVDEAVRRVLEAKIRMGLFKHPYVSPEAAARTLADPAHLTMARVAAERSAVLLRNDGATLPLDRRKLKSLALIGPLADSATDILGPWVFEQNRPLAVSILAGLQRKLDGGPKLEFSRGVAMPSRLYASPFASVVGQAPAPKEPFDDDRGIADAVAAAKRSDVSVLVLGESQDMIGESASRSSLDLPGRQQELLDAVVATGKPVVVLLMSARPIDLKQSKASAILDIWYPGSAGGTAVANLLFGDAVPGGKLPFTWPRNIGQIPMIYAHLTSHDPDNAGKRYWNEPSTPSYPFGYGLSYSRFAYSNLKIDAATISPGGQVNVSVDVRNSGTRTADEVAQLYIHQVTGSAARPVRELKGFTRVTLKPGETRTLTFKLGKEEMQYWNAATKDWVIDKSVFEVAVGGDSTATFGGRFSVN